MAKLLKDKGEIRAIFESVCARREMLLIVTPYMHFDSKFVFLEGSEIHALVGMGRESAVYGLRLTDLRLRFPYKFGFLEAPAKLLGFGSRDHSRTLKIELPTFVYENDGRKSYRVEQVGRVEGSFSTSGNKIIQVSLIDLSTTGAKLLALEHLSQSTLKVNDKIILSIKPTDEIIVNNSAIVRHIEHRTFGLEFNPLLPDEVLDPLSSWVFKKEMEERERIARLMEQSAQAALAASIDQGGLTEGGILLISKNDGMTSALQGLLSENRAFRHVLPAASPIKDALRNKPHLVILHLTESGTEERRRVGTLMEAIPSDIPILLLGTGIKSDVLFTLGNELKASSTLSWAPAKGVFLQRLVTGMLRSHYGQGEFGETI